ncbi:MAG: Hpt domain-containing protein [Lachnospiraceae bacterium]|nr:Hpt domain-containing protein [Lachnospiraceae bacterium]
MSLLEELKDKGVDIEEGLHRMMNNVSLYERMLRSFPKMMKGLEIPVDFDGTDYAEIIEKAHSVKGAAGNLSLTPVYKGYTEIVDLLRKGQPEQAREVLVKLLPVQKEIIDCIEKHS